MIPPSPTGRIQSFQPAVPASGEAFVLGVIGFVVGGGLSTSSRGRSAVAEPSRAGSPDKAGHAIGAAGQQLGRKRRRDDADDEAGLAPVGDMALTATPFC